MYSASLSLLPHRTRYLTFLTEGPFFCLQTPTWSDTGPDSGAYESPTADRGRWLSGATHLPRRMLHGRRPGVLCKALRQLLTVHWRRLSRPLLPSLGRWRVLGLRRPGQDNGPRLLLLGRWAPVGLPGRLQDHRGPLLLRRLRHRRLRQLGLPRRLEGDRWPALLSLTRLLGGCARRCLLATRMLRIDISRSRQADGLGNTCLLRHLLGRRIPLRWRLGTLHLPLLMLLGLGSSLTRHMLLQPSAPLLSWLPTQGGLLGHGQKELL